MSERMNDIDIQARARQDTSEALAEFMLGYQWPSEAAETLARMAFAAGFSYGVSAAAKFFDERLSELGIG